MWTQSPHYLGPVTAHLVCPGPQPPRPHEEQPHWNRPPSGHKDPGVGRWPAEGRDALNEDSDFFKKQPGDGKSFGV